MRPKKGGVEGKRDGDEHPQCMKCVQPHSARAVTLDVLQWPPTVRGAGNCSSPMHWSLAGMVGQPSMSGCRNGGEASLRWMMEASLRWMMDAAL